MVHAALDAGVNLFDTADVYSLGVSEEILGKALRNRGRKALKETDTNPEPSSLLAPAQQRTATLHAPCLALAHLFAFPVLARILRA